MTAVPNVGPSEFLDTPMKTADCEAVLRRACFGHLAFAWERNADVRPIRYAYREDWVYFRADLSLRKIIAASPWLVLSVTEFQDRTRVSSVIVRGGCYETESTGTTFGDAAALQGIMELRDRAPVNPERAPRVRRTSTVFRLHVDELRGVTAFVPCPAGERLDDASEMQPLHEAGREQTAGEDERADDDGMPAQEQPRSGRPGRLSRPR
jgi:nitroimidazol reductase NimA-like FMN-containing flavoprotein (pyridoxamine 5'-phosphate oxidase superfamily)